MSRTDRAGRADAGGQPHRGRLVGRSAWRAAVAALLAASALCASAAELSAGPSLTLTVPSQALTAVCQPVDAPAQGEALTLRQTFVDNFDRLDLAEQRWLPHYDGGYEPKTRRWLGYDWGATKRTLQGNREQQIYVDPGFKGSAAGPLGLDPFSIADGVLSITARPTPPELRPLLYGYGYTSGLLTSRASLVQRYGYFEMRAQIPAGKALWPAFWLLGADKKWPPEIDVLEVIGQQSELMVTTVHYLDETGKRSKSGCRTRLPRASEGFHTFGALWTPERIVYYIDRVPVVQLSTPHGVHTPMYMLLNLAVGGNMVGVADAQTPMPSTMKVDWVAAYALPGQTACQEKRVAAEMSECTPK